MDCFLGNYLGSFFERFPHVFHFQGILTLASVDLNVVVEIVEVWDRLVQTDDHCHSPYEVQSSDYLLDHVGREVYLVVASGFHVSH